MERYKMSAIKFMEWISFQFDPLYIYRKGRCSHIWIKSGETKPGYNRLYDDEWEVTKRPFIRPNGDEHVVTNRPSVDREWVADCVWRNCVVTNWPTSFLWIGRRPCMKTLHADELAGFHEGLAYSDKLGYFQKIINIVNLSSFYILVQLRGRNSRAGCEAALRSDGRQAFSHII